MLPNFQPPAGPKEAVFYSLAGGEPETTVLSTKPGVYPQICYIHTPYCSRISEAHKAGFSAPTPPSSPVFHPTFLFPSLGTTTQLPGGTNIAGLKLSAPSEGPVQLCCPSIVAQCSLLSLP